MYLVLGCLAVAYYMNSHIHALIYSITVHNVLMMLQSQANCHFCVNTLLIQQDFHFLLVSLVFHLCRNRYIWFSDFILSVDFISLVDMDWWQLGLSSVIYHTLIQLTAFVKMCCFIPATHFSKCIYPPGVKVIIQSTVEKRIDTILVTERYRQHHLILSSHQFCFICFAVCGFLHLFMHVLFILYYFFYFPEVF